MESILANILTDRPISDLNQKYLKFIRRSYSPKVIYDIGASTTCWSRYAQLIFPDAEIYMFDADDHFVKYYQGRKYFIACLGNDDDKDTIFYDSCKYNDEKTRSCYMSDRLEPNYKVLKSVKLDTLVKNNNIPLPDLVKINCCGSEKDVIDGGLETIKNSKYMIVNLQNDKTWIDAPTAHEVGPYIQSLGFDLEDSLDSFGLKLIDYVFKNKNI